MNTKMTTQMNIQRVIVLVEFRSDVDDENGVIVHCSHFSNGSMKFLNFVSVWCLHTNEWTQKKIILLTT